MAAGKARTDAQKARAKDLRLQHKYGITLANRDARIREQNGRCKCCGVEFGPDEIPYVDHYHFRISITLNAEPRVTVNGKPLKWVACGFDERGGLVSTHAAATKTAARAAVKAIMLPWSVRGILCFKCNRGLGLVRFFDAERCPDNLLQPMKYLKNRLAQAIYPGAVVKTP